MVTDIYNVFIPEYLAYIILTISIENIYLEVESPKFQSRPFLVGVQDRHQDIGS